MSALLQKAKANHKIKGIMTSQQGVCISHLFFADDNLLFCRATVEECQNLLTLLEKYEAASGQAINRQKTSLFFSKNTRQDVRNTIQQMLRARVMHDCESYLGLPMTCGRSKVNMFKEI